MRRALFGVLAGAGLMAVAIGLFDQTGKLMAQHLAPNSQPAYGGNSVTGNNSVAGNGELIAVPSSMGERGQMLTVIDPRQQTIGVYSIEAATGKITLRSVRNIHYDLQMTDFNGDNPLPREIRLQLEQR